MDIDLDKLKFLEEEKKICNSSTQGRKIKFVEDAMKYLGMSDQEAYRYLRDSMKKNTKKYYQK